MSSVGFLIFDGLWREISARVSRFVRSASGRTAEKRRNLARSKMRGFLRGQMDRALAFDVSDHLRHRILRWNGKQHMHVIWQQMPFLDLRLLLRRELTEDFPKMPPQFLIQHLTTALWNKHNMIFALPSRMV